VLFDGAIGPFARAIGPAFGPQRSAVARPASRV
jgi:hypothetical protein